MVGFIVGGELTKFSAEVSNMLLLLHAIETPACDSRFGPLRLVELL
jgi:hypothetical protein